MEVKEMALPSINPFASDYIKSKMNIRDFFHYDLAEVNVYNRRIQELKEKRFQREELSNTIAQYMNRFGMSEAVRDNIEALKDPDSTVVIGGQQAGLLSGPLYTIHKIISIIKLAEKQSVELGKKVIPVFWIAGEDHDLQEVNHVFALKGDHYEKITYPYHQETKTMVSDTPLIETEASAWIQEIFRSFGETAYTKDLIVSLKQKISSSFSLTDFFVSIINDWFKEYGLLLVDAADPRLRKLESSYFEAMIEHHCEITSAVLEQQSFLSIQGYKKTIEMEANSANLFYYDKEVKDRILLHFNKDSSVFSDKAHKLEFTYKELLEMAKIHPERLSNNVVTRPLMQEMLFPVLAFIAGPGEISYWAELKKAFELFDMKMPPIVARLNMTFVERQIEKELHELDLDLYEVLTKGTEEAEKRFLISEKDESLELLFYQMKGQLNNHHKMFSQAALVHDRGLEPLLKKNADFINEQLDFIYGKIIDSMGQKHRHILDSFKNVANHLYPEASLQERIVNIYYYLNKYGDTFIDDLMKLELEFNNQHKIIYI
jgi:bacillithiol biosynthesis cysteine-adding enzyme BshC